MWYCLFYRMAETQTKAAELYPGVFDSTLLTLIPEDHLRLATSNDWYQGDLAFPIKQDGIMLDGLFHFQYKPEVATESGIEICDLSGLFFVFDDTGLGEIYSRAINGSSGMNLDKFLCIYLNPSSYPDLADSITAMNTKVAKLDKGYTQITPPIRERQEVIPQVSALADELGLSLQKARLERFKNIGRIIAAASKQQYAEPRNNDCPLWVSDDSYRYECLPLRLAPLGGIAIRNEFELPITKEYIGEPEKGKLYFVRVEHPTVEPVVIGLDGKNYLMTRIDNAQSLPYKRYRPSEEYPIT
jgi:hypothetical protein